MNLKEHKKDIIAISSLMIIVTAITLLLLNIDGKAGVYYVRDVYFYLNNALFYAGYTVGLADMRGLSPLIPMITSLFFRMGFLSDFTIIAVSSSFYVFAILGMYFLLRLRYDEILSFAGSMILSTFPLVIVWVTKGMLDIPGMCLSIWAVYFMILSFKRSPRFLLVASPLIILGFFTRFTVLLMVPVLLIQFLLVDDPIGYLRANIREIILAIAAGALVFAVFIGIYLHLDIGLFFVSQGGDISNSTNNAISGSNIYFYIKNFLFYLGTPNYIPYSLKTGTFDLSTMNWTLSYPSVIAYVLVLILIAGLVLYVKNIFANHELMGENKIKLAVFIIAFAVFILTFLKISIIISIIILSISLIALYRMRNNPNIDDAGFDFIMFYWFAVNFIFITYYHIKVDRYFMPILPAVAYFIILSLTLVFDRFKAEKNLRAIVPVALVCAILLCSGAFAMSNTPHTYDNQVHPNFFTAASEEKAVGEWLMQHDSDYMNRTIWADRGGDMSFILRMHVPSYERVSNESHFTDEMVKNNVTYFITKDNKTINEPYVKLYQNGEVSLYESRYL